MAHIVGATAGDPFTVRRTILNIPTSEVVVKAWLTIKARIADVDGSALAQLDITSTETSKGQIEQPGIGGTTSAVVRFDLTAAQTTAIGANVTRYFDIQVLTDQSSLGTVDSGEWTQSLGVTITSS